MRRVRACALLAASFGTLLALIGPVAAARAFIPEVDRTLGAIAEVNRASGRAQALQLDLTMRVGDREAVAQGEMILHPSGLARLELRGYGGRVDRYLLSGDELLGAKDGLALETPQPLLQPLFLLQPTSRETLRAALETFGVKSHVIGLAPCGELDCFVIGDPRLAAPIYPSRDEMRELPEELGDGDMPAVSQGPLESGAGGEDSLQGPLLAEPEGVRLPRVWVDTKELQVRRIDRASGDFVILGPIVSFQKVKLPAWFEVHEVGRDEPLRFEIDRAVQVNAPPTAFSRKWLLAPVGPGEASGDDEAGVGSTLP
ncbi:MAG: hypothetical protein H6748_08070 [Spirochaetaceae bacterium]|nr:hypothetical protein [Myxococcales bacterium]MCB9723984.1 hypothetical protein [Spirochaetaceae bacterium]HPG24673.1 hypothetical protein [Myxococcota bacterium]